MLEDLQLVNYYEVVEEGLRERGGKLEHLMWMGAAYEAYEVAGEGLRSVHVCCVHSCTAQFNWVQFSEFT